MTFQKAERKKMKLKMALAGPAGAGKTYSALRLAKGLGGKIALIDTERGSASLYSTQFDFDVLEIQAPYATEKYIAAIQAAVAAKYDVLIVDSLSHQWAGEGGLLNKKEQMDARGGNSFANWAKMTPEHEKFKSALLNADTHVIGTLRAKQDYILETNDKGKQVPRKIGLAPIQREGLDFEFDLVFDVAMNHEAQTSKDRTGLFTDKIFQVTEETGKTLSKWLVGAMNEVVEKSTGKQDRRTLLVEHAKKFGWSLQAVQTLLLNGFEAMTAADLTDKQFLLALETIETTPPNVSKNDEMDAQQRTNVNGLGQTPAGQTISHNPPPPSEW